MTGLLWVLLMGCPRSTPPEPVSTVLMPGAEQSDTPTGRPIEAGRWSNGQVGILLPSGWTGTTGPPDASLVVRATEPSTATVVEVWLFPRSGPPMARPRPGCQSLLDDPGRYRAVPALSPSASHSCYETDGTLVQGWYGVHGDSEVHVEAIFPPGAAFRGRVAIERFLDDLTLMGAAADGRTAAP